MDVRDTRAGTADVTEAAVETVINGATDVTRLIEETNIDVIPGPQAEIDHTDHDETKLLIVKGTTGSNQILEAAVRRGSQLMLPVEWKVAEKALSQEDF